MNKMFEIRLADADDSLRLVGRAVDKAIHRKDAGTELAKKIQTLSFHPFLPSIDSLIQTLKPLIEQRGQHPELFETLEFMGQLTNSIEKYKPSFEGTLQELKKHFSNDRTFAQVGKHRQRIEFHEVTTRSAVQLKQQALEELRNTPTSKTPSECLADLNDVKLTWNEHIEAVAGLVLRDENFDEGLSILADRLTDACGRAAPFLTANTLNILGRDQIPNKEVHYALYFRFPAWSIWALPFVAHEFWHAARKKVDENMEPLITKLTDLRCAWAEPAVQDSLADVFATFVMGPSYPFACILLSLNPASAEHRARAEAIFAALEWLKNSEGTAASASYYGFAGELRSCWNEVSDSPASEALVAMPVAFDIEDVRAWATVLAAYLPRAIRYDMATWTEQGKTLDNLLIDSDEKVDAPALVNNKVDIRHVLHAAWEARWKGPNGAADMAKRAKYVCEQIVSVAQESSKIPTNLNAA